MSKLTLSSAQTIISAALAKAESLKLKPLTVAVIDAGGHLVAMVRQDNSSILRPQIAFGKAYGAVGVGVGSRWLNTAAAERPHFVQALNGISGGAIVPVPGGVLIRDGAGEILGAVGISGDTSDHDEACAVAGIEAAGFKPDCG